MITPNHFLHIVVMPGRTEGMSAELFNELRTGARPGDPAVDASGLVKPVDTFITMYDGDSVPKVIGQYSSVYGESFYLYPFA